MEPAEIVHRIGNQINLWRERSTIKKPNYDYTPYPIAVETFKKFKEQGWTNFFNWGEEAIRREQIQSQFPDGVRATLEAAAGLLGNNITFFGQTFKLDIPINWFKDPLTGNIWPKAFWAAVDIRDGKTVGGVKWVRELNRHHHFVTLGKAYWLSGEERFAELLCNQFSTWIEQNPPLIGVNWTSALGNAIRVINWIWALQFIYQSPSLSEELFGRIISALVAQVAFISHHLSKYSSANNHLIGEAAGLAFVGLTMPWLHHAKSWQKQGMAILTEEIEKQIYPDGVMAEQAINYLAFDLDFYLLVWQTAVQQNLPIPAIWQERLEAACNFIGHIMDESGGVPAIGDSDDGRVLALDDHPKANRFQSILATAAVLLKRPDFKALAGELDEKSYWLLGESGRITFESLAKKPPQLNSRAFKDGGYYVMRQGNRHLLFDCGPLGYLSLAAHGHADTLSLLLTIGGQPILVDPGTYAYREEGDWRRFFRGTSAHNTIVIDSFDQSEMQGDFLWGRQAKTRILNWQTNDKFDLCTAEHDGYLPLKVTHRRSILFYKPDWILVKDFLDGEGSHQIEQNWHFPKQAQVVKMAEHIMSNASISKIFEVKGNKRVIQILTNYIPTLMDNVLEGQTNPIQGWISKQYGHKVPAPVLSVAGNCKLPLNITSLFNLGLEKELPELIGIEEELRQIAHDSQLL